MMLPDVDTYAKNTICTLLVAAGTTPFFERRDLLHATFLDDALLRAIRSWHDEIDYRMFVVPDHLVLGEIEKLYSANPELETQIDAMMRWIERCANAADKSLMRSQRGWGNFFATVTGKSRRTPKPLIARTQFPSLAQAQVVEILEAYTRLCDKPKDTIKASVKPLHTSWWPYGTEAEIESRASAMTPEDQAIYMEYYVDRQIYEIDFDLTIPTFWFRKFVDWYVTETNDQDKQAFLEDALAFGYQDGHVWLGSDAPLPLEDLKGPPYEPSEEFRPT